MPINGIAFFIYPEPKLFLPVKADIDVGGSDKVSYKIPWGNESWIKFQHSGDTSFYRSTNNFVRNRKYFVEKCINPRKVNIGNFVKFSYRSISKDIKYILYKLNIYSLTDFASHINFWWFRKLQNKKIGLILFYLFNF